MSTRLFWPLSGCDFTRSIKWSHTQINAVAAQIRGKLSQFHPVAAVGSSCNIGARLTHISDGGVKPLAGQTSDNNQRLGVNASRRAEAAPLHLGTKYLNTSIGAKPAVQGQDQYRNSADGHCRGRLDGNF